MGVPQASHGIKLERGSHVLRIADRTKGFSLTLLVAVTIAYVIGIRSLPLPIFFSLLKCLNLKRAPSYFANGIDLCYRLYLLS